MKSNPKELPRGLSALKRRLLWVLYSDVRSRVNTLLAEFRHTRLTAYAHMKHACPDVLDNPFKNRRVTNYSSFGIRERQFLAIADTAAHEIEVLLRLRCELSDAYDMATAETHARQERKQDSLYWFIAKRARVIEESFADSTTVLSHVHDKLIQMVDTAPGIMPQPLYLRRWQSATHEKFLSAYCRDQNLETAKLVAFLNLRLFDPASTGNSAARLQARRQSYGQRVASRWLNSVVTHVWNHQISSEEIKRVGFADAVAPAAAGKTSGRINFVHLRSVFFYLEQPILFPLLFHELAHGQIDLDREARRAEISETQSALDKDQVDRAVSSLEIDNFAFLRSKDKAAQDLRMGRRKRGFTLENDGADTIATEIWADAIGVVLGGAAFVHSLTLQILGQLEVWNLVENRRKPASSKESIWHVQLERHDDHVLSDKPAQYFCYARILVAVNLAELLYERARLQTRSKDDQGLPFQDEFEASLVAIRELWSDLKNSGSIAYSKSGSSGELERSWLHYCDNNEWAAKVCISHLTPHVERMWQYILDNKGHAYHLRVSEPEGKLRAQLWRYFDAFCEEVKVKEIFSHPLAQSNQASRRSPTRIEDAALGIRWETASMLFQDDIKRPISEINEYLDTTRWDGLAAFRYLLDWYQTMMSSGHRLYESLMLEQEPLTRPMIEFVANGRREDNLVEATRIVRELLESRLMIFFVDPKYERWGEHEGLGWVGITSGSRDEFHRLSNELTNGVKAKVWKGFEISEAPRQNAESIATSMLCLGAIRPSRSGPQNNIQTLAESFSALAQYVCNDPRSTIVLPAIGEYSYVRWARGRTPSNLVALGRDNLLPKNPQAAPRHFEKARVVLKVAGSDLVDLMAPQGGAEKEHFVSLSLIKYKHRAYWLEFRQKLEELFTNDPLLTKQCGLFLSSGWEDVVFMRIHRDIAEISNSDQGALGTLFKQFISVMPNERDTQTLIVTSVPDRREIEPAPSETIPNPSIKDVIGSMSEFAKSEFGIELTHAAVTFGRYDASISWGNASPFAFQSFLHNLPGSWLQNVGHMLHGVGWEIGNSAPPYFFTRLDLAIH